MARRRVRTRPDRRQPRRVGDLPGLGLPRLLDGQLLAPAATSSSIAPEPTFLPVRRLLRQLPPRALRRPVLRRALDEPRRDAGDGRGLADHSRSSAALAISRFRFRGRDGRSCVALLLIQMLPVEGLFIAQYKMLRAFDLLNTIAGLTLVYIAAVAALHDLDAARLRRRRALRARGGRHDRRLLAAPGVPAGSPSRCSPPVSWPPAVFAFLQAWNEFTVAVVVMTREDKQDAAAVAGGLRRRQPRASTGVGVMAASTLDRGAGDHLLPARPGSDDQRAHRRGGEGMSPSMLATSARPTGSDPESRPSVRGTDACPTGCCRLLAEGLGGLCLFGSNTADGPAAVAAYTAQVRSVSPGAVVAVDEEGGDVTRLHVPDGSPVLGPRCSARPTTWRLTRAVGRAIGARAGRRRHQPRPRPRRRRQLQRRQPGHRRAQLRRSARRSAAPRRRLDRSGCSRPGSPRAPSTSPATATPPRTRTSRCRCRRRRWRRCAGRELVPFAAAVAAGTAAVMTSHIVVPALDPEHPATLSAPVLRPAARRARLRRGHRERRPGHGGRAASRRHPGGGGAVGRGRRRPALHRRGQHRRPGARDPGRAARGRPVTDGWRRSGSPMRPRRCRGLTVDPVRTALRQSRILRSAGRGRSPLGQRPRRAAGAVGCPRGPGRLAPGPSRSARRPGGCRPTPWSHPARPGCPLARWSSRSATRTASPTCSRRWRPPPAGSWSSSGAGPVGVPTTWRPSRPAAGRSPARWR